MLKFRRRRRSVAPVGAADLRIKNLLDDPRLNALVGDVDPSKPIRPARLDWSRPDETIARPAARRRQLLRAA